jgi:multidrug resistance efflux pump
MSQSRFSDENGGKMKKEMTKQRKRLRLIMLGLATLAIVGVAVGQTLASPQSIAPQAEESLAASGVIQAEQVTIASEFGGRIADIPVTEAEGVITGQVVVQLDTTMLDAQIEVAQAMVELAEAGLAQAKAGARPGQIDTAKAQLAQAEAGQLVAQQAVSDTQSLVENPQDIDLLIAVTRAQLESAEHKLAQATAFKDAIEVGKAQLDQAYADFGGGGRHRFQAAEGTLDDILGNLDDQIPDLPIDLPDLPDGDYNFGDWEITIDNNIFTVYKWVNVSFPLDALQIPNLWWQSWIGVNAATATKEGLEAKLNNLYAQRAQPLAMQTRANAALSAQAQVEAQVELAQTQVEGLKSGATPEQIAAIEARVAQARSGLDSLLHQREMLSLTAPIDGIVLDITMRPGEVAAAGATLLTVADLDKLTLTVYVPQNRLGQVYLDQPVQITINSFPERVFEGHVSRIADRAEFTPRNVATQEERVNLVFAVEIAVVNQDGVLKPGMPADVVIGE